MNPTEALARLSGTVVPTMRAVPERLIPVAAQYVANLRQIQANTDLNDDGRRRYIVQQREGAIGALGEVVAVFDAAMAEFTSLAAIVRGPAAPDSIEAQLLAELQAGRTWDRLRRQLDAAPDMPTLARLVAELRTASDLAGLRVLREEGPAYLVAAGSPLLVDSLTALLDDAEADLRPEVGELRKLEREVMPGRDAFRLSASAVRDMIEGRSESAMVSSWDGKTATAVSAVNGRPPIPSAAEAAPVKPNPDAFGAWMRPTSQIEI